MFEISASIIAISVAVGLFAVAAFDLLQPHHSNYHTSQTICAGAKCSTRTVDVG